MLLRTPTSNPEFAMCTIFILRDYELLIA